MLLRKTSKCNILRTKTEVICRGFDLVTFSRPKEKLFLAMAHVILILTSFDRTSFCSKPTICVWASFPKDHSKFILSFVTFVNVNFEQTFLALNYEKNIYVEGGGT